MLDGAGNRIVGRWQRILGPTYHCGDDEFLSSVYLWKTPLAACGDDRGDVCMDYSAWTNAWTEIRGAG